MDRRYIQGQRQQLKPFFPSVCQPLKCCFINIIIQSFNLPGFFQNRKKTVWKPQVSICSLPTDKYFCTGNFLLPSADFWLEINLKFFLPKCFLKGVNSVCTFLFSKSNFSCIFAHTAKLILRLYADDIGVRNNFFAWNFHVFQIINTSVQGKIIYRISSQNFFCSLLVRLNNSVFNSCMLLSGNVNNSYKDI